MRLLNKKTKVAIASSALLLLSVSSTAYAYWTTTGSGTATATTGTNIALTVTQDGSVTGLVPGGTAQAVNYTINNSASTPQYATTVTINKASVTYTNAAGTGTGSTALDHPAGMTAITCTTADFDVVQPDSLATDLAPGNTSFTRLTGKKSGTIAMLNTASNQDDCKNTTVNLSFTIA
jgi:asparagine N-glycosylation enzyme membrane subunit Stt3